MQINKMTHQNKILVINPNSTKEMTYSLKPILEAFHFENISHDLFTAPGGPRSINNEDDAAESMKFCLPAIEKIAHEYAGFLVGCFSAHPLVPALRKRYPTKHVLGIFEASISCALAICGQSRHDDGENNKTQPTTWGIVTTGKAWEPLLTEATQIYLGADEQKVGDGRVGHFESVQSTGFDADQLHDAPKELVRQKLSEAATRLTDGAKAGNRKLSVIVLGCAGMAELEGIVREVVPSDVRIVDGVKAGYCQLATMIMSDI